MEKSVIRKYSKNIKIDKNKKQSKNQHKLKLIRQNIARMISTTQKMIISIHSYLNYGTIVHNTLALFLYSTIVHPD